MRAGGELLLEYARSRSEEGFAGIVSRHVNFVYAAASRMVGGDVHLAQDVAQGVFIDLARKAGLVAKQRSIEGWLYQAARFGAAKLVRGDRRRTARERETALMDSNPPEEI